MSIKTAKPKIEDIINQVLADDLLKNALDFIAYLKENKLNPLWSATNVWKISYQSYSVCFIRLYGAADYHNVAEGSWHILPFVGEYEDFSLCDEFKQIVWTTKKTCRLCGKCSLELSHLFGKKYDYICEKSLVFTNPDTKTMECIKELLKLRKNAIKEGKAKKHKYIPLKNR